MGRVGDGIAVHQAPLRARRVARHFGKGERNHDDGRTPDRERGQEAQESRAEGRARGKRPRDGRPRLGAEAEALGVPRESEAARGEES